MKLLLFFSLSLLSFKTDSNLRNETEAWQLANRLYEEISSNRISFASAAVLYSEDAGSAKKGGDLGWLSRGILIPEYENLAWTLPVGSISKPFSSVYGIMILQVIDRNTEMVWTRFILITYEK